MLAADVSKYTGIVTPKPMGLMWKSGGGELAIVGSWHGTTPNKYAHQTLYNAQAANLQLATYIAISGNSNPSDQILIAKKACGDKWDNLVFVAVDVEQVGDHPGNMSVL